jgi:hypothetical protein
MPVMSCYFPQSGKMGCVRETSVRCTMCERQTLIDTSALRKLQAAVQYLKPQMNAEVEVEVDGRG